MIHLTLLYQDWQERALLVNPAEISTVEEPDPRERWYATVTMRNGTVHHVKESPAAIATLLAGVSPQAAPEATK